MLVVVVHSCGYGNRKGGAGVVAAALVRECYMSSGFHIPSGRLGLR